MHKNEQLSLAEPPLAKQPEICYLIATEIEILKIDQVQDLNGILNRAYSESV